MINRIGTAEPLYASPGAGVPWLWFLFLSAVFLITGHHWSYSLLASDISNTTVYGITTNEFLNQVEQGSLLRQVVFCSLGIVATFSLFKNRASRVKTNSPLGWLLLAFLCWAFLSIAWSEDPALVFRRLVLLTMLVLGALAVSQRFTPRDVILFVLFSTLLYLNIGIAAELQLGTFHPFSWGYRFAGTIHPNAQSVNCVLLFYASYFLLKDGRRWRIFLVGAVFEALIFLFLTKTRTSLALAGVVLILHWVLNASLSRKAYAVLCLICLSCLVVLLSDFFFPMVHLPTFDTTIKLGRMDTDTDTLTGRIPLWEQLLPYIAKRPIQGYGYGGFWSPHHIQEVDKAIGWTPAHAHSNYLTAILDLGMAGGIIYTSIIVLGIKLSLSVGRRSNNSLIGFMAVTQIFAALDGLLEPLFIIPGYPMFVIMLILLGLAFSMRYSAQQNEAITHY